MQQTGTGTALDQYVSPKNSIKSCQKYIKNNIGMEQSKIIDTTETYQHPQA